MKKLFFSLSLAAISLLTYANHTDNDNFKTDKKKSEKDSRKKSSPQVFNYKAKPTIDDTYSDVTNLRWSNTKDGLIRADFNVFDETKSMFFQLDGSYIATTTEMQIIQLPAKLRYYLLEKFDESQIINLIYYSAPGKYGYYAKTSGANGDTVWEINDNGNIDKFRSL